MSLLARAPSPSIRQGLARSRIAVSSRSVHIENTLGNNMPFSYNNKRGFAVKLTLFMVGGFAIPFAATAYQLKKAGGGV